MFRFVILAIGFLSLFSICANYMIINFTFICMTNDESDMIEIDNGTLRHRYDYSPKEKSYIHWGLAINWAYVRWGAKYPFFVSGITSAISTALTQLAAQLGIVAFVIVRFLQGIAFAADFAALGMLTVRWAPIDETGIFLGFLTSFTPLASTVSNAASGMFCTTIGWKWSFYSHSLFTLFIFILWLIFYSDDPQSHWGVKEKELKKIQKDKTKEHINRDTYIPYKAICTNKTILVVWLNALTELVAVVSLLTYAPIYLNKVLGLSIESTAFWTAMGSGVRAIYRTSRETSKERSHQTCEERCDLSSNFQLPPIPSMGLI